MSQVPANSTRSKLKPELADQVRELLQASKPISAILRVRDDMQIDLAQAKALVEAFITTERLRLRTSLVGILSAKNAHASPLPARANDEGQRAQQMTRERGEG